MPALYLQSPTPPSSILQSVFHPPSPSECTATVRVVAGKIMLGYKRNFLKTVLTLTNAVVLMYSCLASSTQTTVGFAVCTLLVFLLLSALQFEQTLFWKYFHFLQYALVPIILASYHCCHAVAVWTINIQEENAKEGTDLSYSYSASLCSHKGMCQYKTRESAGIWINRRGGSETERAGSALVSIKTTLGTTV